MPNRAEVVTLKRSVTELLRELLSDVTHLLCRRTVNHPAMKQRPVMDFEKIIDCYVIPTERSDEESQLGWPTLAKGGFLLRRNDATN